MSPGVALMTRPVGGGGGGVFAQAWRFRQSAPYDAPYSGGPADADAEAAGFRTLDALILSYIDSALASIVPHDTGGSNVTATPAAMNVTASDGLGSYTFGATGGYTVEGSYNTSGVFSTADNATLSYSFHESGFTPDGGQFTLDDTGTATMTLGGGGNHTSHVLTPVLTGSDSYSLVQTHNRSAGLAGAFFSADSATETVGGADSFSLTETQTETVDTGGAITGGTDTFVFGEQGTDTSSFTDLGGGSDTASGVNGSGGSTSSGHGSGGHTLHVVGADAMGAGGFLGSGTNQFTWGESSSESTTTTESDSQTVAASGYGQTDTVSGTETVSNSETYGATGTEDYTSTEGANFGWTEHVSETYSEHATGSDVGADTDTGSGTTPGGGDSGREGDGHTNSYSDSDTGQVRSSVTITGNQTLSGGTIGGGALTFTWSRAVADTDSLTEWSHSSSSDSDSGTYVTAGETVSSSETESATDSSTVTDVTTAGLTDSDTGTETMGQYGLLTGGTATVTHTGGTTENVTTTASEARTATEIETETDSVAGGTETHQTSDVTTTQDGRTETDSDTNTVSSDTGTLTLGYGGLVVGWNSTNISVRTGTSALNHSATVVESGTATEALAGSSASESYRDATTDSEVVNGNETDTPTESDSGNVTLGAGGTVTGGSTYTSFGDGNVVDKVTTTATHTENHSDVGTETDVLGNHSLTSSMSDSESLTSTSTESDTETSQITETTSLALGAAAVVLSGTGYSFHGAVDQFQENGTDTGGMTHQEQEVVTNLVAANSTSGSFTDSSSSTETGSGNSSGTDQETEVLNSNYGAGGVFTGGTRVRTGANSETLSNSSGEVVHDSHQESDTESDTEAGDFTTRTYSDTVTDTAQVTEASSEQASGGYSGTYTLGAEMAVLNGTYGDTQADTDVDGTTKTHTSTATDSESGSFSDVDGGDASSGQSTERTTLFSTITDTENDTPTVREQDAQTLGAAGVVVSGSSSFTLIENSNSGEVVTETEADTATDSYSDSVSAGSDSSNSTEQDSLTSTETVTGSDTGANTLTELKVQFYGTSGAVTGGTVTSSQSGSDTGSRSENGTGTHTYSSSFSDSSNDSGQTSASSGQRKESGTFTTSGSSNDTATVSESLTETLGSGGIVLSGLSTESQSESGGNSYNSSETGGESSSLSESESSSGRSFSEVSGGTGSYSLAETGSLAGTLIETISEALGIDGVATGGHESQTLQGSTAHTVTETDTPTETVTDSAAGSNVTMTLTETVTTTDTSTESDNGSAGEDLGASATIAAGSDSYTVDSLNAFNGSDDGSGTETSTDTSRPLTGTASVHGSSTKSGHVHQTFGDAMGAGGAITAGSLSYTVDVTDSGSQTKTEGGTESLADESDGPSQTASLGVNTTTSEQDNSHETGTETLGAGGTIAQGSATFSWGEGNSSNRLLTLTGVGGSVLNVTESSTNSFGFAESGTESITAGGADAPGTVNFVWDQMGTDSYSLHQANHTTSHSYLLDVLDSVSSSWHDTGIDSLTTSDTIAVGTDTYTWNDMHSVSDHVTDTLLSPSGGSNVINGTGLESVSISDTGCDTLSVSSSGGGFPGFPGMGGSSTQVWGTDSYHIYEKITDSASYDMDVTNSSVTQNNFDVGTDSFSLDDAGTASQSGTLTLASHSYAINDHFGNTYGVYTDWLGNGGHTLIEDDSTDAYDLSAGGTDSIGPGTSHQSTLWYNASATDTDTSSDFSSGTSITTGLGSSYSDPFQLSDNYQYSANQGESGSCTQNNGSNSFTDTSSNSYSSSSSEGGNDSINGAWGNNGTQSGQATYYQGGDTNSGSHYSQNVPPPSSSSSSYGNPPSLDQSWKLDLPWKGGQVAQPYFYNSPSESLLAWTEFRVASPVLPLAAGGSASIVGPDRLAPRIQGNYTVFLQEGISSQAYPVPLTVITYRRGGLMTSPPMIPSISVGSFNPSNDLINLTDGKVAPNTDAQTADGLPSEEQPKLPYPIPNIGASAGVAQTAPPTAADILVALAGAGRNPTQITLPVWGGGASGGGGGSLQGGDIPDMTDASAVYTVDAAPAGNSGGNHLKGYSPPQPGGYWGGWVNPLNWHRGLYTGDPNAPDEYYQAATDTAGESVLANSDNAKTVVDVVSVVDPTPLSDTVGAGISYAQGKDAQAAQELAMAAVPGALDKLGKLKIVGKMAGKADNAADAGKLANKIDDLNGARKVAGKADDAAAVASKQAKQVESQCLTDGACFAAGTPLLTPDGSASIEDLRPGDWVMSRPEDDPEAPPRPARVVGTFASYTPLLDLYFGNRVVRTTPLHPFWVRGRGWSAAHELIAGDHLLSDDWRWVTLTLVLGQQGPAPVYNVEVEGHHTYFVGREDWGFSVWAHNNGQVCKGGASKGVDASASNHVKAEVMDPADAAMGGPKNGTYVAYHGTTEAGAESLTTKGIDSRLLGNPDEFQLAIDPAKAANFGAGAVQDAGGGVVKLVRFEIPEEFFLGLFRNGNVKVGETSGSLVFDRIAQAAINGAMRNN